MRAITSFLSVSAIGTCLALSGCTLPTSRYDKAGPTSDGYTVQYQDNSQQASIPVQSQVIDVTGTWCTRDKRGHWIKNYFTMVNGGIYATPVGRKGGERMYRQTGQNFYSDTRGSGTYEFFDDYNAVWHGGRVTYQLKRCQ